MAEKPKNIGELFKESFEDFEVKGDSSDWSMLEMKLEKLKFFKFNFIYFNIYYASLIALTFLFSSGVLVDYFFLSNESIEKGSLKKENNLPENISQSSDKSAESFSKEIIKPKNSTYSTKKKEQDLSSSEGNKPSLVSSSSPSSDTTKDLETPIEKKEEIISLEKQAPKKKIIYITKQDTLIVVDTVKINKSRRKK